MDVMAWVSKHVFFPLWELKDGSRRAHYLRELSASQWFEPAVQRDMQWKRLCVVVEYAIKHCPYYQRRFAELGVSEKLHSWDEFYQFPILSKLDIRRHGNGIRSDRFQLRELVETKTGGSTGVALQVFYDEHCQEMRNAASMRSDLWAGWDIGMMVAAVWGNPPLDMTVKEKLRRWLLNRMIFLDTMNINEGAVRDFISRWRQVKPQVIFGHAHSIYILATYLRRFGFRDIRPRGIVTTSMMLLASERHVIEEVFQCPVTNRYGCEEVGLIASECEAHHGLHINAEHVIVEFLKEDGSTASPGEEGSVVVTDLINFAMPLIRYRVEDMGVPSDRRCPCGRGLPLMERVVGRQADFLKRVDGSLVAGVSLVERTLTGIPGIEQMQLVQEELETVCVKVVMDRGFNDESETRLRHELQQVFGVGTTIKIEYVSSLDQTSSGKYRFAIYHV